MAWVSQALASATACGSGRPRASRAVIAEESVQPVPWVWRVRSPRGLEPARARRRQQQVGALVTAEVATLQQHAAGAEAQQPGRHRGHLERSAAGGSAQQGRGLGQVGRDQAGQRHEPSRSARRRRRCSSRSPPLATMTGSSTTQRGFHARRPRPRRCDHLGGAEHADLDRATPRSREDRIDLRRTKSGVDGLDALHPACSGR